LNRTSEIVFIQLDSRLTGTLEHAIATGIGACKQLKSYIEAATIAAMAIPDRIQVGEGHPSSSLRNNNGRVLKSSTDVDAVGTRRSRQNTLGLMETAETEN
jgi:hypothetical protein